MLTWLLISVFTFVLLAACRVPNALPRAVSAGLAEVLPYIGALLSVGPAVLAATAMMLIEELRVELPGEQEQPADTDVREADERSEEEYERRAEGVGAEEAAAIAVEISQDRREDERRPPQEFGTTIADRDTG